MTLVSTVMAGGPRALRMPSGRTAHPAQGATATTGPARHRPSAARTCGGQVRGAQLRDRQGGEGGSGSRAGGLTYSCLQARGWQWRLASATASPKAAGLGSPCSPAGERPLWPNSPGAGARDVPLPGATRRSSAQRSLGLSRGLSDGGGGGATLPAASGMNAQDRPWGKAALATSLLPTHLEAPSRPPSTHTHTHTHTHTPVHPPAPGRGGINVCNKQRHRCYLRLPRPVVHVDG